jgi:putative tricarboxylic transport membrane protein
VMEGILDGLIVAFTPGMLLYAAAGALIGTLVGVLPGLGPVATIALLLPASFHMTPEGAIILLAGVYYGAQYGSSTTAILVNVPGEASGAITALAGHKLAKEGRAAEALAVSALASLFAGLFAALVLALATPPLTRLALAIGPSDMVALFLLAGILAVFLSGSQPSRSVFMLAMGGLLGLIGTSGSDGQPRFSFGVAELRDGIDFTPLVVGLFGLSEVFTLMARRAGTEVTASEHWWPGYRGIRGWVAPAFRGSVIGSLIGLMPGSSTLFAAFAAYLAERRLAGGRPIGSLAEVAAPEAANNAAAQTSFVTLFGLGIPANAATAVLIGAMMLHGLPPGPALFAQKPEIFWTFIGSLVAANLMLVVLNLPLVGVWARLVTCPPEILGPGIIVFSCVGILASGGTGFDVVSLGFFGLFGYACRSASLPLMPLLLGFVLIAPFEDHLRRAITIARGDWSLVFVSPFMITLSAVGSLSLIISKIRTVSK